MSIFGAIKVADDLENAMLTTLEAWFPTYKKEYELQDPILNVGDLPAPKGYLKANQLDAPSDVTFPALVVVSPGLSGRLTPKQEGDGTFRVHFNVAVGVFVSADRRAHTRQMVRVYCAIVRTILLQQQDLGGYGDGLIWLDESYDDAFPFTETETISAGQVVFEAEVSGVVSRFGGPAAYGGPEPAPDPANQPGEDWPTVLTTTPTVTIKGG